MNRPPTTVSESVSLHLGGFTARRIYNGSCRCRPYTAFHDGNCADCSDMKLDRAVSAALRKSLNN